MTTRRTTTTTTTTTHRPPTVEAAHQYCRWLARSHYENFTVGSWLLPEGTRRHMYAIYAYCRTVDDLGDEATIRSPQSGAGETGAVALLASNLANPNAFADDDRAYRLALLDLWEAELEACYTGAPTNPVMVALEETIEAFDLPRDPFLKLIEANRMDQHTRRHPTYQDLLHYCEHSANPVGRLVLYLFGYRDGERQRLSDATCTALQLTNFWQDVARDWDKGRIYIPLEDMDRHGYTEEELARRQVTPAFRELMAFQVERAMDLFRLGAPLAASLEGKARLDVALFTRGGVAVLEAIRRQRYDVLVHRPKLSRSQKAGLFLSTWLSWKLGLGLRLPEPKQRN